MREVVRLSLLALVVCPWPIRAVTCARDTVPAATLLVPYFRVSRNGADGAAPIPAQGTNTVMAITNTGTTGVITHFTVYNKYGKAVFGFNVPLQAWDVAFFDMRQILNGDLNLNPNVQTSKKPDVCTSGTAGYGPVRYRRFDNPDREDQQRAISVYSALGGDFLIGVRDSLDESGDVTSFLSARSANILDDDNPICDSVTSSPRPDGHLAGDFSGYMTIDVVNYCTNHGPSDPGSLYFVNDAIATIGWPESPNVLMGDVFYVDPAASGGNVSGDPMVALELDPRLANASCSWANDRGEYTTGCRTFYSRYFAEAGAASDPASTPTSVPEAYRGIGDGREPLASRYGFRYLSDQAAGLQSWAVVWRSDLWEAARSAPDRSTNLCEWWADCLSADVSRCRGYASWREGSQAYLKIYNNDGVLWTFPTIGCPAVCGPGCRGCAFPSPNVFLESQRVSLGGNADLGLNDPNFKGGWIDVRFAGLPATGQAWVGVQHSAPGQFVSVGHGATVLSKAIECVPALFTPPAEPAGR